MNLFYKQAKHLKNVNQLGQSMVEVLASIVIFSVGILGALAMQAASLSMNQSSYYRAQAIVSANDIIERMRSNRAGVLEGYYQGYLSNSPPSNPGCTEGSFCDEESLANYDLFDWSRNFENVYEESSYKPLLPEGEAEISYNENTLEYSVRVSWSETDWNPDGSGTKLAQTKSVLMRVTI